MRQTLTSLTTLCLFTMAIGLLHAAPAAPPAAPVVVVGIQVGIKGFGFDEKWNRYDKMPFNMQRPGIEVALALSYPAGGIIELDDDNSELVAFRDDHKTDLLAKPANAKFGNEPGFGSFPKVIEDGKVLLFSVTSPTLPAKGTRVIGLAGKLALLTGSTKKTDEAKGVALKAGTTLKLGDFDFEISKVGKPDWGDDAMQVTVKTSKVLDGVISFSFHAADGSEIESSEAGSSTTKFGAMVSVDKSFNFKAEVSGPVTVRMLSWADMKRVKVPFRVKTGLMP
jgi:hypothetical protein